MQDAIIIGGGISGLVCAYQLRRLGRNVLLIDTSQRAGGAMKTETKDGFLYERGPNSFQDSPALLELLDQLGITPYLVTADNKAPRYVYYNGKLRPIPMSLGSFITSGLMTLMGKLRLLAEPFIAQAPQGEEQTVEQFITRRFGKQVHDVLVSPFVSGVYAGNSSELSAMAASPFSKLADLEAEYGSITRGMFRTMSKARQARGNKPKHQKRLCSFLTGLEALPRALQKAMVNELLLDTKIHGIEFHNHAPQAHYTLELEFGGDIQPIHTASLIIATPAFTAAKLLSPLSERLAALLDGIPYPPLVSVALGYSESQLPKHLNPLQGFGFLIPRTEGIRTLGCIWNSALFPERAPNGHVMMTCFIGGSTDREILTLTDDEIIKVVHQDLQKIMGISGSPKVLGLTRWERVIPQYVMGYPERRHEIESLVHRYPGLYLTGNYLYGISIGDCVECSRQVADQVEEYLVRNIPPSTGVTPSTRTGSDLLL